MGGTLGVANVAEQEHVVAQKWGAVSGLAWPPECWLTGTGATPATIVLWTMHTRDTADDLEAGRILAVRLYRSVRRQIFRKFVRPHRRYLSILTSAKRADLYGLDREQAYAPSWQRVPIPAGRLVVQHVRRSKALLSRSAKPIDQALEATYADIGRLGSIH